jgi:uncharacterized hydrophobic protein (TIGR00271 family)
MDEEIKVAGSRLSEWRNRLAVLMGVSPKQKETIYIQIAQSASLRDVTYWLQILFSAGIATLGLVLNSPAVIIGAMLISPLMGPILAAGLALAAGDLVLSARAIINLTLSCTIAICFAVLLVALLPFKEVTAEIAARTHPNTLDLVIALFSGAIGSIATCKEVKGVVTSIPGVAIAVALMPPLCVVGFGLGVAISTNAQDGVAIAWGGGLLFLTNLVAITFTAMIVFLALHIDTEAVRKRVKEWRAEDQESNAVRSLMKRLPAFERLRVIGSLPARLMLVLIIISLILVPLSQSFTELRREIERKNQENRVRQVAAEVWEQSYSRLPDGSQRGLMGQLSILNLTRDRLSLLLRVFTSKPLTDGEKSAYTSTLASRLNMRAQAVALQLIEIPTATSELLTRAKLSSDREERPEIVLSFPQLQRSYSKAAETALAELPLPLPAQLLNYEVITEANVPARVRLVYLSDREIEKDAQELIVRNVRERLDLPDVSVNMERVETLFGPLTFGRNQSKLTDEGLSTLDRLGLILQQQPKLNVEVTASAEKREPENITDERAEAIREYLTSKYQISTDRITAKADTEQRASIMLNVSIRPGP